MTDATAVSKPKLKASDQYSTDFFRIVVPYLILFASQLPLSLVYFKNLWQARVHFGLFPLAFLAFGFLLYLRWPRTSNVPFYRSGKSDLFLYIGLACGVMGTLLVSPWLAYASLVAFVASFLARTDDEGKARGRLLAVVVPLVVLLPLPMGFDFENVQGDIILMNIGNNGGASLASDLMDLSGGIHNRSGSRIEMPQRTIDLTMLGNRAFSMFGLLIITGIYIAILRRPFLRGLLLLVAAGVWSIAFEAIAVLLFSMGFNLFTQDWFAGNGKSIVESICLFGAVLMIMATDQLLLLLLGPVDTTSMDDSALFQVRFVKFWNHYISGSRETSIDYNDQKQVAEEKRRNRPTTIATSNLLWVCGMVMTVLLLIQLIDVWRGLAKSNRSILANRSDAVLTVDSNLFPSELAGWTLENHDTQPREIDSPFDGQLDRWTYRNPDNDLQIDISIRHAYPGWHDLVQDMMRFDWMADGQSTVSYDSKTADDVAWPVVSMNFNNEKIQHLYLMFSQIDGAGEPFTVPQVWNQSIVGRCFVRMGNRARPRLGATRSIEISASGLRYGPLTQADRDNVQLLFDQARNQLRNRILDGSLSINVAQESAEPTRP